MEPAVVYLGGIVVSIGPLDEEDAEERDYENSEDDDENHGVERYGSSSSVFDFSASHSGSKHSGLPSANDVFSQVIILFFILGNPRIHQIRLVD